MSHCLLTLNPPVPRLLHPPLPGAWNWFQTVKSFESFYLSLFVFSCLYLSLFVCICLNLSLFVFICLNLSLFALICLYLSLFVFKLVLICLNLSVICLNLSLFVFICRSCRTNPVDLNPVVLVSRKRSMKFCPMEPRLGCEKRLKKPRHPFLVWGLGLGL